MPRPLSISTCWNSHRHQDGRAMLEELAGLGFDTVELGHGVRFSLWPGVREAVDAGVVKISSLHNFCPLPIGFTRPTPIATNTPTPALHGDARLSSIPLRRSTPPPASEPRASSSTSDPPARKRPPRIWKSDLDRGRWGSRKYVATKISALEAHEKAARERWPWVRDALLQIGEHAKAKNILLGLECRECVEEFPLDHEWDWVFAELGDSFGYWHDFGHAARKDAIGWIEHLPHFRRMAPRLIGCHMHDFNLPAQDHQALGEGILPFADFWPCLKTDPVFVLELSPRVTQQQVDACRTWWIKTDRNKLGALGENHPDRHHPWFIIWKNRTNGPAFLRELQDADLIWICAAFLCIGLGFLGGAVRWNILLGIQKISMTVGESWRLVMIGVFFNNFLPGSTGGDVIKIFYALRHAPSRKAQAVLSVIMDRILGLIAILSVTMLLLPLGYRQIVANTQVKWAVWMLGLVLAVVICGLVVILFTPLSIIPAPIRRLWIKIPKREILESLYESVISHGRSGGDFVRALLTAALAVVPILSIGYCLARSLHLDITIGPMTILFAIVICAMSIPLSFSGHGIREGAFTLLFGVFGVTRHGIPVGDETALACSTLFLGVGLLWSLVGGLIYLTWSHRNKMDPKIL